MTFLIYEDIGRAPEIAQMAWDIPEGEDVEIRINSCGGDVYGGLAIVAAINTFRTNGHKTRAVVEGLAASMASVVACACDELVMHEGSMLMVHNPWTLIEGDAEELRKQAEIMGKIKNTMIGVYQKKFAMSSEEISRLMDEETWISTDDIEKYKLDAEVIEGMYRIAASVTKADYYSHIKERRMTNEKDKDEDTDEQKPTDEQKNDENPYFDTEGEDEPTVEKREETEEKPAEEKPTEDTDGDKPDEDEETDEKTIEELRERIAELERENEELRKQLDAPVEERVRGMQSKMQSRINAQTKDFEKQLRAKTEELATAQAKATSLQSELDKTKGELSIAASALSEKTHALAELNAGVLTPHAAVPTPRTRDEARRALAKTPMNERADYYKTHRDLIDG